MKMTNEYLRERKSLFLKSSPCAVSETHMIEIRYLEEIMGIKKKLNCQISIISNRTMAFHTEEGDPFGEIKQIYDPERRFINTMRENNY